MEGVSFFAPNLGWLHLPRVVFEVAWHVAVTSRLVIIHEGSLHGLSTSKMWCEMWLPFDIKFIIFTRLNLTAIIIKMSLLINSNLKYGNAFIKCAINCKNNYLIFSKMSIC